jgi:hypothetical protein
MLLPPKPTVLPRSPVPARVLIHPGPKNSASCLLHHLPGNAKNKPSTTPHLPLPLHGHTRLRDLTAGRQITLASWLRLMDVFVLHFPAVRNGSANRERRITMTLNTADWKDLVGQAIEIRFGGRHLRHGVVEVVSSDSSIMWLGFDGVHGRQLIMKTDAYEIHVPCRSLSLSHDQSGSGPRA